jgi:glutathione reductase (NADPH)
MVYASAYPAQIEDARAYGWDARLEGFDWAQFRRQLDEELNRLERAYRSGLVNAGVTIHDCRATLVDAHTVRLATGERITAKHILIATGGHPFVPEVQGAELAITSNDIFRLDTLPASILIVGGGFIACEFACILRGLGVSITQYYRGAQILRGFDDEARGHVADAMIASGVDLHCGTDVMRMEKVPDGVRVVATNGEERVFGAVLYATGRKPNSAGIGLEALGVQFGRQGEILVDGYSQTAVPSIFAVGDVTDRINLTPVAIREGHAFADTVFKGTPRQADHDLVASAVFTQPELGTVGLTEEEARAREPIEVYVAAFRPMQSLFAGRSDRALFKLVVSQATQKVLGCHIVAPGAGEMIQMVAIAMKMGATKADFDRTCAVHPTMAEELVTMKTPVRRG